MPDKQTMHPGLKKILADLEKNRGFDFSGATRGMIERRMQTRMSKTGTDNYAEYFDYIQSEPDEYDRLIDVLTINVSRFFRDPLCFGYLEKIIIPPLIEKKLSNNEHEIRIWSAGCASGEEAYTMAIIMTDMLERTKDPVNVSIFATDINEKSLQTAREGTYNAPALEEIKFGLLGKYFVYHPDKTYTVIPRIRDSVYFSSYDLLDRKTGVPRDSLFGGFDIVLCRNVLIYYEKEIQEIIFKKLLRSLNPGGILMLGEAEVPDNSVAPAFSNASRYCKIFMKK
ncbi:MAG: protein-glutamate O-methyltransferase CheR [Bacteroidales bacterium]